MELAAIGCMGSDVGPCEVFALEQQLLAGSFGQRVSEAVTEIERCRMVAAAEIGVGLASNANLRLGDRLDAQAEVGDQSVQLASRARIGLAISDDARL